MLWPMYLEKPQYRNALKKNARYFGMPRRIYRDDVAPHKMFPMSKVIALLPPTKAVEGFEVLKWQAYLSKHREVAAQYIAYFQKQWMECDGPENFSVYAKHSNNDQENFQ